MKWLRAILELAFSWWAHRQRIKAVTRLRSEGVRVYMKVLQGVRMSLVGVIAAIIALQLLGLGFAMMASASVFLSPWDLETKLWVIFGIGAGLFTLPFLVLAIIFSERLWYKVSGAERMVDELLHDKAS